MSQAKVDKRKQEKYNRKNAPKKSNIKKYASYTCVTLAAAAVLVYFGYSIALDTGLYVPETTTTAFVSTVTAEELASKLQQNGDSIGFYTKAVQENPTTAPAETKASEEATTVSEETKEDK